jgi:hypothetical protein
MKDYNQLILEMGVVLDQIKACRRGAADYPKDEIFKAAIKHMFSLAHKLKRYIEARPEYTVDKMGNVYDSKKNLVPIRTRVGKSGRPQLIISTNRLALAAMVAAEHVPNPHGYTKTIFKDNDPTNCKASNLVYVSNEIFALNIKVRNPDTCPLGRGRKKIEFTKEEAYIKAKDLDLKHYYKTKDEKLLERIWFKIDASITLKDWKHVSTECYLYFIDRCRRNSMLGNPYAFVIAMAQRKLKAYHTSINTSLAKDARKIDPELIKVW